MEKQINIAEILKDKPVGTKLYSPIFGEIMLDTILSDGAIGVTNNEEAQYFLSNGKFTHQGECLLFPSKEMRDWSKFAWKKGDVLVEDGADRQIIFDRFLNDEYKYFKGKHILDYYDDNNHKYHDECSGFTMNYSLEDKDAAQCYINTIEERLGGKLNMETLEIEPTKPKCDFKPFDRVVACSNTVGVWSNDIFLYMGRSLSGNPLYICIGDNYIECLPYNEETAKLIGTSKTLEDLK